MTSVRDEQLMGLPDDLRALLSAPPLTEKKLLELGITWPDAEPGHLVAAPWMRMAAALRAFVITWDPLEVLAPRPDALATANVDESELELVVYLPWWSLAQVAEDRSATLAEVLATVAGSAVMTAAEHEQSILSGHYPDLVQQGAVPDLLADLDPGTALGPAEIASTAGRWEDIGLGAITDVVQHAFGTVDLDRSPVELAAGRNSLPDCPACRGRRFGFPGDLAESRERMCRQHQREATAVINRRLARANASNVDGWGALTDASSRLERPHLPNGLATRLADARMGMPVIPEPAVLAERAALVVEATSWFTERPRDLALALGEEPWAANMLPDWLVNLPLDLARAGLGAEADAVADALARVNPDGAASYQAEVVVALAEAGLADHVHPRLAALLARWPDDLWCRMHAGDALAALGDVDEAASQYTIAKQMAEDTDDFEGRSDAVERLVRLERRGQGRARSGSVPSSRHATRRKLSRSERARRRGQAR